MDDADLLHLLMHARRAGFTFVELAVLAALAAVLLPTFVAHLRNSRGAALGRSLGALREAVYEYRTDVRRYPTNLRYLSAQPASANDLCERTVPPAFLASWQGPYTQQAFTAAGFRVGAATIQDTLATDPATFDRNTAGVILVTAQDVDSLIAVQLDDAFDANSSLASGTIRWTPTMSAQGTLTFTIPVEGC